jgi:Na+/proline symporter
MVASGLVPVVVAYSVLGKTGSFLVIMIIIFAVTSTASAEVMAVTSMLFYDVYQVYIQVWCGVLITSRHRIFRNAF